MIWKIKALFLIARLSCRNRAGSSDEHVSAEADPGRRTGSWPRHSAHSGQDRGRTYTARRKDGQEASRQRAAYQAILKLGETSRSAMYLKKHLKYKDLKSFANRIVFQFRNGITGIVRTRAAVERVM